MKHAQALKLATQVAQLLTESSASINRRRVGDQSLMAGLSILVATGNQDVDALDASFHEIILFGSVAKGKSEPEDVDLMVFDKGFYSNVLTPGKKASYGQLKSNLGLLLTGWFGYDESDDEIQCVVEGGDVDLLVMPLSIFSDENRRKQVEDQQSDPNFFRKAFSNMHRFDPEKGQFVRIDLSYFAKKYGADMSAFTFKRVKKAPCQHVWFGDFVRAKIPGERYDGEKFTYEVWVDVTYIEERFGVRDGQQECPLIQGAIINWHELFIAGSLSRDDSREIRFPADQVMEIMESPERAPWPPYNNYTLSYLPSPTLTINTATYTGDLWFITNHVLGKLPFYINREIDAERLWHLFYGQLPGFRKSDGTSGCITVTRKVFDRWVRKNWSALLKTKKKLRDETFIEDVRHGRVGSPPLPVFEEWTG